MGKVAKNIALVGLPLSYKTTVAKKLASKMNAMSVDTDELVEFDSGMTIAEIFNKFGEKAFREMEEKAVAQAVGLENMVISTGGGAVESEKNRKAINECFVIYLKATPKRAAKRAKTNDRPLLSGDVEQKLTELYNRRKRYYENCDMIVFVGDKTSDTVTEEIFEALSGITTHAN